MSAIRTLLKDGKRSQRGSVLSGVLFMTAFIAIISGALMTELSTNFLLSHTLMIRVANQATINSAVEQAMNQLGTTPISSGCPGLNTVDLNGRSAVPTYASCWPTFREQQYPRIASSSPFKIDGSHSVITRQGQKLNDFYLVGDSGGKVYQFSFGSSVPNWSWQLPGSVSGPPVAVPDMGACCSDDIANLVPLSVQSSPPPPCQAGGCVAFLAQDIPYPPDALCYMAANGPVTTAAAVGVNNSTVAFFGDQTGSLFAYSATETGNCALLASISTGTQPVVGGPVVFAGPTGGNSSTDEIYLLASDGTSSRLLQYTFTVKSGSPRLSQASALSLPASSAVGVAIDSGTLPARLAITFAGGTVSLVQIQSWYGMALLGTTPVVPSTVADAPSWCCGSSPSLIGVAQTQGLYVLDGSLRLVASYRVNGTTISTSPAADSGGDWFFGANDGNVYEVPAISSSPTSVKFGASQLGQIRSSAQVGACSAGICIYLASLNGGAYMVPLDARDAVITACVSTSPPSCSGANPRLSAQVEIGAAGDPRMVHVQGWSYYSP